VRVFLTGVPAVILREVNTFPVEGPIGTHLRWSLYILITLNIAGTLIVVIDINGTLIVVIDITGAMVVVIDITGALTVIIGIAGVRTSIVHMDSDIGIMATAVQFLPQVRLCIRFVIGIILMAGI
jgi:hypothetical protein